MVIQKKSGFTLIELLIVIAIIGVLAGIILMSVGDARNKALITGTKGSISSLKTAIAACCNEPGNWLQDVATQDLCTTPGGSILPQGTQMNLPNDGDVTYGISNDCDMEGSSINIQIQNHPVAACNSIYTVSAAGVFYGAADLTTPQSNAANTGFPAGC